jgi:hypothetical protein
MFRSAGCSPSPVAYRRPLGGLRISKLQFVIKNIGITILDWLDRLFCAPRLSFFVWVAHLVGFIRVRLREDQIHVQLHVALLAHLCVLID